MSTYLYIGYSYTALHARVKTSIERRIRILTEQGVLFRLYGSVFSHLVLQISKFLAIFYSTPTV